MTLDKSLCVNCGKCASVCDMDVNPVKELKSAECIKCGKCVDICPKNAIKFRFRKQTPYQGAVHTPLLIQGPGIAPGTIIDAPVAWQDLMPTILDLADASIPDSCDGISLKDQLLNAQEAKGRSWLYGETLIAKDHFGAAADTSAKGNLYFENGAHYLVNSSWK